MCETVRTAQDRTPVLCEMCEMPIGIALRTAFRTARRGHSVSHSGRLSTEGRGRPNASGKRQPLNWRLVSDVGEVSDLLSLSF